MITDQQMLDVLRSTITTPGELCAITVLTTTAQRSPAICSDFGEFLFVSALLRTSYIHTKGMETNSLRFTPGREHNVSEWACDCLSINGDRLMIKMFKYLLDAVTCKFCYKDAYAIVYL